jgi:hypothetical protein
MVSCIAAGGDRGVCRFVARTGAFESAGFAEESYAFLKAYEGRLNHVSKLFIEAKEAGKPLAELGADDSQAHGIVKVGPKLEWPCLHLLGYLHWNTFARTL